MLNLTSKYSKKGLSLAHRCPGCFGGKLFPKFLMLALSCFLSILLAQAQAHAQGIKYSANNVELKPKEDKALLTGNAFVRKKNQGLKADKIIMDNKNNVAEAFGKVIFLNRDQGVYYKGDFVLYQIEKETILSKGNASIENRKENTFIAADQFNVDMKKNTIISDGHTKITADKGSAKETYIEGDRSIYNLNDKSISVFGNVSIIDKELVNNVYVENYHITCLEAVYIASEQVLECKQNVHAQKPDSDSFLTSDFLRLEKQSGDGLAIGNAVFLQKKEKNNIINKAERMQLFSEKDTIVMSENVVMYEETFDGKPLSTLSCDSATNYLGEKSILECYGNGKLRNFIKDTKVDADLFIYYYEKRVGYAKEKPVMIIQQTPKSIIHIYSPEMRYQADEKKIYISKPVSITNYQTNENNVVFTNQTIFCDTGVYDFRYSEDSQFKCTGHVVIHDEAENTDIFSERLTHLFSEDTTYLTGNANFIQHYSNGDTVKGKAEEIQLYSPEKRIDLLYDVVVEEFDGGSQLATSRFRGPKLSYLYKGETRQYTGSPNVLLEKPLDNSFVRSEYLFYDVASNTVLMQTNAVFVNEKEDHTKTLAYADTMKVFLDEDRSELMGNISITEIPLQAKLPRQFLPNNPYTKKYDYILCDTGEYFFKQDKEKFNCYDNVQVFRPSENTIINGDILTHYFPENYSVLETKVGRKNLAEKNKANKLNQTAHSTETSSAKQDSSAKQESLDVSESLVPSTETDPKPGIGQARYQQTGPDVNHVIYADTMKLFNDESRSVFIGNVLIIENDSMGSKRGDIRCEESTFLFSSLENKTFRCERNVKVHDYRDNTSILSKSLFYDVQEEYSKATGDPYFKWVSGNKTTEVTADILERFDKQSLMYAKGTVIVDNGINKASSSLGIYSVEKKIITLFGTPKILDKASGDEVSSREIIFDLEENKMLLKSDIQGSISID